MNELLDYARFNFFSIGSLIAVCFNFFVFMLFITIRNRSKASFSLMMVYLFLGLQNIGYLFSSTFDHPFAAYHRWLTVFSVIPGLIFMNRFFFVFPAERAVKAGKSLFYMQWFVSLAVSGFFFFRTWGAEPVYLFGGHYWDFAQDPLSYIIALVINGYILAMIGTGIWRISVARGRDRINLLMMLLCFLIITILPGIFNAASRTGIVDRGVFQVVWNLVTVIGFFFTIIVYINITEDRTTILAKIVGISMVTMLLMFQVLSFYIISDVESSYDKIQSMKLERFFDNKKFRSDDLVYVNEYSPVTGVVTLYNREGFSQTDFFSNDYNSALLFAIPVVEGGIRLDYLAEIREKTNSYTAPFLDLYYNIMCEKKISFIGLDEFISINKRINRKLKYHSEKISEIDEEGFHNSLTNYIAKNSDSEMKYHFTVLKNPKISKNMALDYMRQLRIPGQRDYRKGSDPGSQFRYVLYTHSDINGKTLSEAAFFYDAYRAYVHTSAGKIKIIILAVVAVILVLFPLFLLRSILSPLYSLVSAMKLVHEGDFEIDVPVRVKDEIGYLTARFNKMVGFMHGSTLTIDSMRKNLKNIIDSMHSALITVDDEMRITYWNARAESETGTREADAVGKDLFDMVPLIELYRKEISAMVESGKPGAINRAEIKKDSDLKIYEIEVFPLINNNARGAVVIIDEITSRVRMEEAVIQSEKMMSVGGLAAGMAHEINNPLSGILMASQNIIRRISPDLKKNAETAERIGVSLNHVAEYLREREVLSMMNDIRDMGERASKIVSNMLSFSRKSGSRMLKTGLAELLNNTIDLAANDYDLKKKYDFRHIKIERVFDKAVPEIECVFIEVQQVLFNLLKNAAQILHKHRSEISDPKIIVRLYELEENAVIEVEDNGPGMPENIRRRIFEPFFTTKDVGSGTGLGLSVSYFIIKNKHGGDLIVDSEVGSGTRFILKLPFIHKVVQSG